MYFIIVVQTHTNTHEFLLISNFVYKKKQQSIDIKKWWIKLNVCEKEYIEND